MSTISEDPRSITFSVLRIEQPIGVFYAARLAWKDLFEICFFDIRRMLKDEREFETYLGIQRPLNDRRVQEIQDYVTTRDATFPTAVIIAVDEKCASLDEEKNLLTLSNYLNPDDGSENIFFRNIARVIDGQHRIKGLEGYSGGVFDLNVTIFVGIDVADQAMIFSTVNLAQTKVNKSLVYDLFDLAKTQSPQKTAHDICIALDRTEGSPFYRRIKRLGTVTEGRFGETLSQAVFVSMLLPYLSINPIIDRDALLRGRKLASPRPEELERMIFRGMFVREEYTKIAKIVRNYFEAVARRWPEAWASTGKGHILPRTNGFRALMRALKPMYLHLTTSEEEISVEKFETLFSRVKLTDTDFSVERYKPGTGGETALYRDLVEQSRVA